MAPKTANSDSKNTKTKKLITPKTAGLGSRKWWTKMMAGSAM
jgi:hypothetical protein